MDAMAFYAPALAQAEMTPSDVGPAKDCRHGRPKRSSDMPFVMAMIQWIQAFNSNDTRDDIAAAGSGEDDKLVGQRAQPRCLVGCSGVLLQGEVEVGAAEAEGADTSTPGVSVSAYPGTGGGGQEER